MPACALNDLCDSTCDSVPGSAMIPIRYVPRDLQATHDVAPIPMRAGHICAACYGAGAVDEEISAGYVEIVEE